MTNQVLSGAGVGTVVAALSWRGNTSTHLVSVFPDLLTLMILAALLFAVIWFELRRAMPRGRRASLRVGFTIASAAGVILGTAVMALGVVRFSAPFPTLLIFLFCSALVSAVAIGALASTLMWGRARQTV